MGRFPRIKSIRRIFNIELPTSFISMGLFIDVPFSAFGCNVWKRRGKTNNGRSTFKRVWYTRGMAQIV